MIKNNACIIGTAKNIFPHLPLTIKVFEQIASFFTKCNIIIYENDSDDNTLEYLEKWKEKSSINIKIISEKNIEGPRTHVLAYARNKLIKEAIQTSCEYIIVSDMDNVLQRFNIKGFLSCFHNNNDWAAVGANGMGHNKKYYDLWALRTYDNWCNTDVWEDYRKTRNYNQSVDSKHIILPDSTFIKVESCFGGMIIYKTKYLDNCTYSGIGITNIETCEHVSFNKGIIKNGGVIYINTDFKVGWYF